MRTLYALYITCTRYATRTSPAEVNTWLYSAKSTREELAEKEEEAQRIHVNKMGYRYEFETVMFTSVETES